SLRAARHRFIEIEAVMGVEAIQMKIRKTSRVPVILAFACYLVIGASFTASAFAQQGELILPSSVPRNQRQGGSVLEVPAIPGKPAGRTGRLPALGPQQGQELVLPSRQLAKQPGYKQVTVTIIDHQGRYVTGLQKTDFKLFIDGQQRPIEFFRQDL